MYLLRKLLSTLNYSPVSTLGRKEPTVVFLLTDKALRMKQLAQGDQYVRHNPSCNLGSPRRTKSGYTTYLSARTKGLKSKV